MYFYFTYISTHWSFLSGTLFKFNISVLIFAVLISVLSVASHHVLRSAGTLAHSATSQSLLGTAEAQLSTHHCGCSHVPVVITNSSPLAVLQHLHSALADHRSASKTHQRLLQKPTKGLIKKYFCCFLKLDQVFVRAEKKSSYSGYGTHQRFSVMYNWNEELWRTNSPKL